MSYKKLSIIIGMFGISLIVISLFMFSSIDKNNLNQELENKDKFMDYYLGGENHFDLALDEAYNGDAYYDYASESYDTYYFEDGIYYCTEARYYYSEAAGEYDVARAMFIKAEEYATDDKYAELSREYVNLSELGADLMYDMYEACEYFEASMQNYIYYYDSDYESYYEIANAELESMNEKIRSHDNTVNLYNKCLGRITALKELE